MGNTLGAVSPEERVMYELRMNPFWPFQELSHNVYQLRRRKKQFYYAFILMLANTIGVLYLCFVSGERNVIVINVFIYMILIYQIFNFYNERLYLLFTDRHCYKFYIGDKLATEGHYHNIYIRLRKHIASDERMLVKLVLDGYGIEPLELSKSTSNYAVMRGLGMKIAKRLDINFFDIADVSRLHKIRHRCPEKQATESVRKPTLGTIQAGLPLSASHHQTSRLSLTGSREPTSTPIEDKT